MKKKNGQKVLSLFLVFTLMMSVVITGLIPAYAAEEVQEATRLPGV